MQYILGNKAMFLDSWGASISARGARWRARFCHFVDKQASWASRGAPPTQDTPLARCTGRPDRSAHPDARPRRTTRPWAGLGAHSATPWGRTPLTTGVHNRPLRDPAPVLPENALHLPQTWRAAWTCCMYCTYEIRTKSTASFLRTRVGVQGCWVQGPRLQQQIFRWLHIFHSIPSGLSWEHGGQGG